MIGERNELRKERAKSKKLTRGKKKKWRRENVEKKGEGRGGGSREGEAEQLYDFIPLWVPLNLQRRSGDDNYYPDIATFEP